MGESVHRTTISHTLHKSGMYGSGKKKAICQDNHKNSHVWDTSNVGKRGFRQMRSRLKFLGWTKNVRFATARLISSKCSMQPQTLIRGKCNSSITADVCYIKVLFLLNKITQYNTIYFGSLNASTAHIYWNLKKAWPTRSCHEWRKLESANCLLT